MALIPTTSQRQALKAVRDILPHGTTVALAPASKHAKLVFTQGERTVSITVSQSPSDKNACRQIVRQVRKLFDPDTGALLPPPARS